MGKTIYTSLHVGWDGMEKLAIVAVWRGGKWVADWTAGVGSAEVWRELPEGAVGSAKVREGMSYPPVELIKLPVEWGEPVLADTAELAELQQKIKKLEDAMKEVVLSPLEKFFSGRTGMRKA